MLGFQYMQTFFRNWILWPTSIIGVALFGSFGGALLYATLWHNANSLDSVVAAVAIASTTVATSTTPVVSEPLLIKMTTTIGTLTSGTKYIYYHDPIVGLDFLAETKKAGKAFSYNNTDNDFQAGNRVLWGAGLTYNPAVNPNCFMQNGVCVATIIGPLFETTYPGLQNKFDGFVSLMSSAFPSAISAAAGPKDCTQYTDQRTLASYVSYSADAYRFTYTSAARDQLATKTETAVNALIAVPPLNYIHSTYETCYGAPEFQTLAAVMGALADWKDENPASALKINTYLKSAAAALQKPYSTKAATSPITVMRTAVANKIPTPNVFGQYLTYASEAQEAGAILLQTDFTAQGITILNQVQALSSTQTLCGASIKQTYGGWYHTKTTDCSQNMGYHGLIVEGVLDLYSLLKLRGYCTSSTYWAPVCTKTPSILLPALAWIINVQNPTTKLFAGRAPGSSTLDPGLANSAGISIASEILEFLFKEKKVTMATAIKISFGGSAITVSQINDRLTLAVNGGAPDLMYYVGPFLSYRTSLR